MEKKDFVNKKKFADKEIVSFSDVFSCVNQDTQGFDSQTVRLYTPDVRKLTMLSSCISKKTALADIIHNILNLYFEQNKDNVKDVMSKYFSSL